MLGVKTGYWTWGALWIPRSTSVWSAICTEEPNTWGVDSLATQQTCYSLHSSLKVVLDDSNRVDKIFKVKAEVGPTNGEFPLGPCRPGKENNKWLGARSVCTKKTYYLRYPLWRDKTGGLDHRQTWSGKHVYQLDFHPRRKYFLRKNETETAWTGFKGRWNLPAGTVASAFLVCVGPFFVVSAISGGPGVRQEGGKAVTDEVQWSKWVILLWFRCKTCVPDNYGTSQVLSRVCTMSRCT